jgi:hypothetical protein
VRIAALVASAICLMATPAVTQYRATLGAPETFSVTADVIAAPGAATAKIQIVIQRYTSEAERTAIERALETGGYPVFLTALRRSSDVGYVEHGMARFTIRYARETRTANGRRIDVVTDRPMFFVGGGAPEPRPRAGFDVAMLRMEVDEIGFGSGVMTGAARLELAPDGGVQIDDYAEQPIRLVTVTRKLSSAFTDERRPATASLAPPGSSAASRHGVPSAVRLTAAPPAAQYRRTFRAPETFNATAQVRGTLGVAAVNIQVVLQRYTPEAERTALEGALETGGYPAFLTALRRASDVGYVEHGTSKFTIRYARDIKMGTRRRIDVVTDRPIYFVGGNAPDAKPHAGFEVAVLRMEMDEVGMGSGVMAAAARLKPAPEGGVQIDDYAEQPIKLVTVTRKIP